MMARATIFTALLLLAAPGALANLLCSGSDATCQTPLSDHDFYAAQEPGQYKFDFFSDNATTIISQKFPNSNIKVTAYKMNQLPVSQLPDFNFATLYWWMPPNSISSPHYHANAVESGTVVKGYCYVFMWDMSAGTDSVAVTPSTSSYRLIANRINQGEFYVVPKGWMHFVFFPCVDAELVFSFNAVDYQSVNVPAIVNNRLPRSQYTPGPGVTVDEMVATIKWVRVAMKDYVYGDSHLYMGDETLSQQFCAIYQ